MTADELIALIIIFAISVILFLLSIMSFLERGFLLNNAYLYASKEERKTMNKKPYYRQSAIGFCALSVCFLVVGLSLALHQEKLLLLLIPLIVGTIIYVIASTIQIDKEVNKKTKLSKYDA